MNFPPTSINLNHLFGLLRALGIATHSCSVELIDPEACDFGPARKYILDGREFSLVFARVGSTIYVVYNSVTISEPPKQCLA